MEYKSRLQLRLSDATFFWAPKVITNLIFDYVIPLWDPSHAMCVATLEAHTDSVNTITPFPLQQKQDPTVSPWPVAFVSGSDDKTVKIWLGRDCIQTLSGHTGYVLKATFLSNGNLVTSSYDKTVRIWERKSEKEYLFNSHPIQILETSYIPTKVIERPGNKVLIGGYNGLLEVWDLALGTRELELGEHLFNIYDLCTLPETGNIVSASRDRLEIFDTNTLETVGHSVPTYPTDDPYSLFPISPDLLLISFQTFYRILDIKTFKWTIERRCNFSLCATLILPNVLALGLASGQIDIIMRFEEENNDCKTLTGHSNPIRSIGKLSNGFLVSGSDDSMIKIWTFQPPEHLPDLWT